MLLEGRTAIIYGGGGSIGGAVGRAFAREGATVHLTGRTAETLEAVAGAIRAGGGSAETAVVDALDEAAVDAHADAVAASSGGIDVSLNVIQHGDVQGTALAEMSVADLEAPVVNGLRTNFITTRAAARHMIPQGSGVLLFFGGYGDPMPGYDLGGLQIAFQAIEALRRQLASELGKYGIRALTLQTAGILESITEDFPGKDEVIEMTESSTMLGRAATLEDVGNVAVFAASDLSRSMTATALNITCGTEVD
ncbi:MAG TPA: SDR family oxidoreductase [Acidimicrobiales bacterium]